MKKKFKLKCERPDWWEVAKKIDSVFSKYIRTRDNWTCVRCGRRFIPPTNKLQNSHYWGRDDIGTRWDPKNCVSLCATIIQTHKKGRQILVSCHGLWEKDKQGEYKDFMLKKLGQYEYDKLKIKAKSITRISVSELLILLDYWKRKLERIWRDFLLKEES